MTSAENDRYTLTWEPGLCRCGCGEPVRKARNRFVNGHDGRLMDVLVDAQREGAFIRVRHSADGPVRLVMYPRDWASQAFTLAGVRRFEEFVSAPPPGSITRAQLAEISVAEGAVASFGFGERQPRALADVPIRVTRHGLGDDLAKVREIVVRSARSWVDVARVDRLEAALVQRDEKIRELLGDRVHPVDPADADRVELAIDDWHDRGSTLALHEYLGWSYEQYCAWVEQRPFDWSERRDAASWSSADADG